MDSKNPKDTKTLASKCMAIVFKERKSKTQPLKTGASEECESGAKSTVKGKTCEELFAGFVKENGSCHWDPHLEESIKNLKYEGHIQPWTVLVTGRDIYLDTVKNAWARRAIRSPQGYSVHRFGEIPLLEMTVIPQTQFTPLPEALCISISELTKTSKDASFDAILNQLKDTFRGLQQPSEIMVYETLGNLIKERKIYHTGTGYHILSPDLHQPGNNAISVQDHHLVIGGGNTANGFTPTLYIPLVNPAGNGDMVSISCQTETNSSPERPKELDKSVEKDSSASAKSSKLDRSQSVREKKSKKQDTRHDQSRDSSREFSRSASVRYNEDKAKGLVKDINLKTSDVHQDKDKGEKSSLLSKMFGRKKGKDSSSHAAEDDRSQPDVPQVELATFSAQFPPPEWQWYEHQVNKVVQPQLNHSALYPPSIGAPLPKFSKNKTLDESGGYQSDVTEGHYDEICVHANTCPISRARLMPKELGLEGSEVHEETMPKIPLSCSSHSDSWSSFSDLPVKPPLVDFPGGVSQKRPVKKHHMIYKDRSPVTKYEDESHSPTRNLSVRPKESVYPPHDFEEHGTKTLSPQQEMLNNGVPVSEMPPERPSHVTKVFKKYRQMKCTSVYNNDITVEYCGKLPKKGGGISMSRDSGVNCIGLAGVGCKSSGPKNVQLYGKNHYNAPDERGERNDTAELKKSNQNSVTVHHAQVHTHASPEDNIVNSPPGNGTEDSFRSDNSPLANNNNANTGQLQLNGPNCSTPKDLSPFDQHAAPYDYHRNDSWSSANSYDKVYHRHSYHDHLPEMEEENFHHHDDDVNRNPVETSQNHGIGHQRMHNELGSGSGNSNGFQHQSTGSINHIWSDTSEQTVREMKSPLEARGHSLDDHSARGKEKRSSSSPPEKVINAETDSSRRRSQDISQTASANVVKNEPFREIHVLPENGRPSDQGDQHHQPHGRSSSTRDHHKKAHHSSSGTKHAKTRRIRKISSSSSTQQHPLPAEHSSSHRRPLGLPESRGAVEKRRSGGSSTRCPIRNYPSENKNMMAGNGYPPPPPNVNRHQGQTHHQQQQHHQQHHQQKQQQQPQNQPPLDTSDDDYSDYQPRDYSIVGVI